MDVYDSSDHVLVIDSGCDQTMIHSSVCHVLSFTNQYFKINGVMSTMKSESNLQVVNAAVLITNPYNKIKIIGVINQSLLFCDENCSESLLQPHQARCFGTVIDDCCKHHLSTDGKPGTQAIHVPGHKIPLLFDGWKTYLLVSKPSEEDLATLERVELTSPLPYEPERRVHTRRVTVYSPEEITIWRKRLGFPPKAVVQKTLEHTSQFIKTVEAESRELMRDHRTARLYPLRPHRINDVCYTDTFFSTITSIRGYTMFQLFSLKNCKVDHLYLMKRKSQAPDTFDDYVRQVGAPNYMISDHAAELIGDDWLRVARKAMIDTFITEPYHQNSNVAEKRGGNLKDALQLLFFNTPWAPFSFWCYALEYLANVRRCLAQRSLDWATPDEALHGETVDISVFRFPWFCPV